MPGCSASHPALSPCITSRYTLHRGGAHCSENVVAAAAQQGADQKSSDDEGAGGGAGGDAESDAHRALSQERMVIRWHQRLAHMSFSSIARLIGLGVEGLKHLNKSAALRLVDREDRCDACAISNLKESSFKASDSRAAHRGELVHCDLYGPYSGNGEYTYALSILDDHSRKGWTFPIADKSSATVTKVMQRWTRQVETYTGKKITTLHTDNGTEFDNSAMDAWAGAEGISWRWTVPGSSEQNGRVERLQGVIQERGRAMLTAARLPIGFWPFAWRYAAYLVNRTPHRSIGFRIPQELWSGQSVDLSMLRTFGCLCWTMQDARHRSDGKLSARGVRGTFLGLSEDRKGWLIYVPSDTTNPLRYSRSVLFDETRTYDEGRSLDITQSHQARVDDHVEMVLPYPRRRRRQIGEGEKQPLRIPTDIHEDEPLGGITKDDNVVISSIPVPQTVTMDPLETQLGEQPVQEGGTEDQLEHEWVLDAHEKEVVDGLGQDEVVKPVGSDGLLKKEGVMKGMLRQEGVLKEMESEGVLEQEEVKGEMRDEGTDASVKGDRHGKRRGKGAAPMRKSPRLHELQALGASIQSRIIDHDWKEIELVGVTECSELEGMALLVNKGQEARTLDGQLLEPTSFAQALSREDRDDWKSSMDDEYKSLIEMGTWELCHAPPGRKLIGCRWVYKVKTDPEGRAIRKKSRLVAQGYTQVEGIDYDETFAPVARLSALRMMVTLAIQLGLRLHGMDVKTAYLNGELDVDLYMRQPPGYDDGSGRVCRLLRTLYGLKQSGRYWYHKLRDRLVAAGFSQLKSEPCLFYKQTAQGPTIILVYVDDVAIAAPTEEAVAEVKQQFTSWFKMTDNGTLTSMLGIRIHRSRCGQVATMNQTGYIDQVLQRYGMDTCKPSNTPMSKSFKNIRPRVGSTATTQERHYFAALIGCLLWLAQGTRMDIAFAVGKLARFMGNPSDEHVLAAKRVLRYLAGTRELGLRFRHTDLAQLVGFSDSDHGADLSTRRSVTGYVFYLHGNPVTWRSKLQDTVSVSSTEAEYVALSEATREAIWAVQLLEELRVRERGPVDMYTDNTGAESLARNPQAHQRTKHIAIHHHLVRDSNNDGTIKIQRVHTDDNPADLLTKGVTFARLTAGRSQLGLGSAALVAELDCFWAAISTSAGGGVEESRSVVEQVLQVGGIPHGRHEG
ncbi:hypothetical protein A4X06_0g7253 [Tilletia controversa]|uniref:Integrase catalytic domain-containing protein n=1 Tax=Tilletia controversa TaxID=13291 RepID=A0A8X7MMI8_9BASI|nr:hypothetical protein A4X06_0g7253 [Tilletia controversa]